MTLRDHFHPPLLGRRHWHSFHNGWAYNIAADLNQKLPEGYFAEANVQFGIEIDVATFEEESLPIPPSSWQPPAPTKTIPFTITTDIVEVVIYEGSSGPVIVGVVEIVSPANKDRAAHRQAFISKCETYLRQGIGLVIVDIVTNRSANLHNELLVQMGVTDDPWDASLYATAYRSVEQAGESVLDMWQEELFLGQPLPTMPLWLQGSICLPIELNATYERTAQAHRIM